MTLHILSQPPSHNASRSCFQYAEKGETVILINDGVYALQSIGSANCEIDILALEDDTKARGIPVNDAKKLISYEQFVQLTTQHNPIQSWY